MSQSGPQAALHSAQPALGRSLSPGSQPSWGMAPNSSEALRPQSSRFCDKSYPSTHPSPSLSQWDSQGLTLSSQDGSGQQKYMLNRHQILSSERISFHPWRSGDGRGVGFKLAEWAARRHIPKTLALDTPGPLPLMRVPPA